jgi:hypothetical protein
MSLALFLMSIVGATTFLIWDKRNRIERTGGGFCRSCGSPLKQIPTLTQMAPAHAPVHHHQELVHAVTPDQAAVVAGN